MCEHITDAFFYEEFAKCIGQFAANEWIITVRKDRHRESNLLIPVEFKRSKLSPRNRSTNCLSKSAPQSCDTAQSKRDNRTSPTRETKDLSSKAKNFDELVLNSDALSTPNELFMLSGKTGEEYKKYLFTEHFGLLYTDAAHIILREANRNLKAS
jgi:hypothetical protein